MVVVLPLSVAIAHKEHRSQGRAGADLWLEQERGLGCQEVWAVEKQQGHGHAADTDVLALQGHLLEAALLSICLLVLILIRNQLQLYLELAYNYLRISCAVHPLQS